MIRADQHQNTDSSLTMAWSGLYRDATAFPDTLPTHFYPWLGCWCCLAQETPAKNLTHGNLGKRRVPGLHAVTSSLFGGRRLHLSLEHSLICWRALAQNRGLCLPSQSVYCCSHITLFQVYMCYLCYLFTYIIINLYMIYNYTMNYSNPKVIIKNSTIKNKRANKKCN